MKKQKNIWSTIKGVLLGVVGLCAVTAVGAFAVQASPIQTTPNTPSTNTPEHPGDTSQVGGNDYSNLVKLESHSICESQENSYPSVGVAESFDGTFASYMNFTGYTPNANMAGLAPAINYFGMAKVDITSFAYEMKNYGGKLELENGVTCDIFGMEENILETPLTVSNTNYYYNGELTSYEAINANPNYAFGEVKTFGVIDYDNNTVELYSVFTCVEVGATYTSADGSVTFTMGAANTAYSSVYTAPNVTNTNFSLNTGFGMIYPYDNLDKECFAGTFLNSDSEKIVVEMIDWNTLSINGVTLTKTA